MGEIIDSPKGLSKLSTEWDNVSMLEIACFSPNIHSTVIFCKQPKLYSSGQCAQPKDYISQPPLQGREDDEIIRGSHWVGLPGKLFKRK